MSKIAILVLSNDSDGVGYYRINLPYLTINDKDLIIDFKTSNDRVNIINENYLKNYQIIVFHKTLPVNSLEQEKIFLDIIKRHNIKLVFDIDDYWVLNSTHINYKKWVEQNSAERNVNILKTVDYITTTTSVFADEIMKINKNVVVLENAVNDKEQQWIPRKIESDKTRFIWGGGIAHLPDLQLLKSSFEQFDKKFLDQSQLYLCGFDLRMTMGNKILKDDPNRSVWGKFEGIFTNNYKWVKNSDYLNWLNEYTDINRDLYGYNVNFKDEFYQRRWTKPILLYGTMYNEADVAIAPLRNTMFNWYKSQLKIIEAGIHNMPIIASNNNPYTIDIIDGKHGFLINETDTYGWYNKMKYFSENKNAVIDMGHELNELVKSKYTIDIVNKKRIEFLKSIIK